MLSWIVQNDYLDTCCFECLICMYFVFLYLHLFRAIEHVSHGKAPDLEIRSLLFFVIIIIIIIIIRGQLV